VNFSRPCVNKYEFQPLFRCVNFTKLRCADLESRLPYTIPSTHKQCRK
jgi:hypothetical protein